MTKLNELMEKAPEHTLREFARKCALRHVEKIKPHCSEKDYQVIVTWLNTGDESIRQDASSAVESAADSAVESAAYWAYWAALSAAESAAESAYWTACSDAESATESTAESAAESAAYLSEIQWQEQTLSGMLESNDD